VPLPPHTPRGSGALTVEQQTRVIEMLKSGASQKAVAERLGVSKNTVAGVWARYGEPGSRRVPTTLYTRLDALHETLDRVLAETRGVGRIPEGEREPRRAMERK